MRCRGSSPLPNCLGQHCFGRNTVMQLAKVWGVPSYGLVRAALQSGFLSRPFLIVINKKIKIMLFLLRIGLALLVPYKEMLLLPSSSFNKSIQGQENWEKYCSSISLVNFILYSIPLRLREEFCFHIGISFRIHPTTIDKGYFTDLRRSKLCI